MLAPIALSPNSGSPPFRRPVAGDNTPKIAFVLHDAGETKAMLPVMTALDQERINYAIVADSTAAGLLRNNPHLLSLPAGASSPADVVTLANSPLLGGCPSIPKVQALASLQQLQSTRCVVTGLVSSFQKAWTDFFKRTNRPVIGYYDGFQCNPDDPMTDTFLNASTAERLDALITPSQDTANYFKQRHLALSPWQPALPITVLGQPVLEATAQAIQTTNAPALANRLGIDWQKPTILFVGGYGNHYPDAFRLFCQSMRQFPGVNALVSLHPKANGALETQLLRETGMSNRIKIAPKTIETAQLLALRPVVLSQDSTMVAQAALQGQTAAYIGQPVSDAPGHFNPLLSKGIVCRLNNPSSMANFIQQALFVPPFPNPATTQTIRSALGIPEDATRNILNYLKAFLPLNTASPSNVV